MRATLLCIALIFASPYTWAQTVTTEDIPGSSDFGVTVHLDRTAVWPGDQFHYLIIVDYSSDYEFVLDNLSQDTVNLDPFEVIDVQTNLGVNTSGQRLIVDLTLANFETQQGRMEIPQFTLFYFRTENNTVGVDQAVAESLTVPGPAIGIRSTLPQNADDIRDAVTVIGWDSSRWAFPVLGWICAAVLFLGSGRELALFVQRRKARKGPDRRKAMKAVRDRWSSRVPSEFTDPKTCSDFFDHSYQNLKEYLAYYLEIPTMGLTAEEMREEMQRLSSSLDLTQKVASVMETCETTRYMNNGVSDHADTARSVAENIREIMSSKEVVAE
jgi:hypothetical protein